MIAVTTQKKKRNFQSLLNQFGGNENRITTATVNLPPVKPTPQATAKPETLTARLNRMIVKGISFDVGTDDFQTTGADNLTTAEKDFLIANKRGILCTLQQGLLMKFLPLDNIKFFTDEVRERASILSDGETVEPPFNVVCEIVRDWFSDVLEEIGKTE